VIEFTVHTAIIVGIYALLALSLNLQYGLTGLLNFGQILFFAGGACAVAVAHRLALPVFVGLALAPITGALLGFVMSLPVRRLQREYYWALVTLGTAELFLALLENEEWIAGGTIGTRGIPSLADNRTVLLALVVVTLGVVLSLERIRRAQFGRVIKTIREDETLIMSLGRDFYWYQVRVMVLGGCIAGIAGAFFAHYISFVGPSEFQLSETFTVWIIMIIGGIGNNWGMLLGSALVQGLLVATRFLPSFVPLSAGTLALVRQIVIGIVLILLIILRPEGALPERKETYLVEG
jgi:ABC-type branched-subunit amino acid transport system permease subunit